MSRGKSLITFLVILMVAILTFTACQPAAPAPSTPSGGTTDGAASGDPIYIGVAAPFTGDAAEFGKQKVRGMQIAIDEINAAGGVNGRPLAIKEFDDKCDPVEAASVAQRLVSDPDIFVVVGHVCSSATLAGAPIYEGAKMTALTVNSSNPTITEKGWKYIFRSTPNDNSQGASMVDFAVDTLGKKNIAVMSSTDDYGAGVKAVVLEQIQKRGATLVTAETYTAGQDKDFSAQLTKIAAAKPDVILQLGNYAESGLILKQRVAAGLKDVPVIVTVGSYSQVMIDLGGEGAEGTYIAVYYSNNKQTPENIEFLKKVADKYDGALPGEQTPWGYDGVYIIKNAIEQGCTKENLNECMSKVDIQGLTGHITFDEKGQVVTITGDFELVKGGKFTTLE